MVLCSVKGCSSKSYPELSFHSFPKEYDRLQKWIHFCKNRPLWKPKIGNRLCSVHFDNESWEPRTDIKRLKCNAIPSIKSNNQPSIYNLKEVNLTDSMKIISKGSVDQIFPASQKILFERPLHSNLSFPAEATIDTFSNIQNKESMLNISRDANIAGNLYFICY